MANIKTYLDKIRSARFGKDVRSSIVNAINAINTESNDSVAKVNAAEERVNTATIKANAASASANEAADNANFATTNANAAAANANEAAQAVLDEKYILTATTEMVKSGSASPTARGNALLVKLSGASWQKDLYGKNLWTFGDLSAEASGTVLSNGAIELPAGAYELSLTYTSATIVEFSYFDAEGASVMNQMLNLAKGGTSQTFTLKLPTDAASVSVSIDGANTLTDIQLLLAEPYVTPDNPQTIHSVGEMGWFDGEWATGCYINNSGGTSIGTQCAICKNDIPCKENDVVLVEYDGELNHTAQSVTIAFYDSTGAMLKRFASGNTDSSLSATAPTNSAYFRFDLRNGVNGVVDTTVKTKVTINDIEYVTILESVGTNELPSKRFTVNRAGDVTYTFYEDGRIGVNGTSTGGASYVTLAATLDKGKYILTGIPTGTSLEQYLIADGDNPYDVGEGAIFEVTERKTYLVRTARLTSGESADNVIVSPMIRKLDSEGNPIGDDTYVPHESKRVYIPLDEPLHAVGGVEDELVPVDDIYKVLRKNGKIILDGTQTPGSITALENCVRVIYANNFLKANISSLCDHLVYRADYSGDDAHFYIRSSGDLLVFLPIEYGTTKEEIMAYFTENPYTIIGTLATLYYEELDQPPFYELQSFDDATHVSIAGLPENLEPTFAMRFPRHEDGALVTTAYCKSKKAEIRMDELTAAMLALGQE